MPAEKQDKSRSGGSGGSGAGSSLWKLSGMGFEFISQVAAGGLLGWLADEFLFGSYPAGLVIGIVAGLIVGLTTLLRSAFRYSREATRSARWTGGRLEVADEPDEDEEKSEEDAWGVDGNDDRTEAKR